MSRIAVILVLISCVTHAGWNLLAKRSSTGPAFFWVAGVIVVLASTPVFLVVVGERVLLAPRALWICLLVTGLFEAAYFTFLALAYRSGHVSLVYPLARTTPVFVVPLAGLIQGQWPTIPAAGGILLAVAGSLLLPLKRAGHRPDALPKGGAHKGAHRAIFWALATALVSSGYTVTDAVGMSVIKHVLPGVRGAFAYGYLEWVSTALYLFVPALVLDGRGAMREVWRRERLPVMAAGALIFFSYVLILWAYAATDKVAYVAGLRQLSIVLGVLGGIYLFREPGGWPRVIGSTVIVIGLVLIALAR